jgi:hypothetical protein
LFLDIPRTSSAFFGTRDWKSENDWRGWSFAVGRAARRVGGMKKC